MCPRRTRRSALRLTSRFARKNFQPPWKRNRSTESHEWIKREGENIRVGITDHAQSELTDVVYVELPKLERHVNAKEPIAVVESVKAASDIYSPVKGTVLEANKALEA